MNYQKAIEKFEIVNKEGHRVQFIPNEYQIKFLESMTGRDVILKCRQIGYSSLILALFTLDFLGKENSRSVILSHDVQSAQRLLDRARFFIRSVEEKGFSVNYDTKRRNELINSDLNSTFYIGGAGSKSFGRGDTITNLLLSEFAFYDDSESMLSSVLQAVIPGGRVIIESTANGMNFFKSFWDKTKIGETGFKDHFYGSDFYHEDFLELKRKELGDELFKQEYPATDMQAFISTGSPFFDREALAYYLANIKEPMAVYSSYHDLPL